MSRPAMLPLLSIYIPTYNRVHLLGALLGELVFQARSVGDSVEIIVSDNSSTDATGECVRRLQKQWPIRYSRNASNLGAVRNILQFANLASGEFTWIIGDDDLVRPGVVEKILSVLKEFPNVDYIFINFSIIEKEKRDFAGVAASYKDFPQLEPTGGCSLVDHHLSRWEEMIDPELDHSFMGAIQSSVFRVSRWREHALRMDWIGDHHSLETTYPQLVIFAHTLRGREAYYIGYPYVIAFSGYQTYNPSLPYIYTVVIPQILDLYEGLGFDHDRISKYRQFVLSDIARRGMQRMVLCPGTPGREQFSLLSFYWKHRHFPVGLLICTLAILDMRPVLRRLRRLFDFCLRTLKSLTQQCNN